MESAGDISVVGEGESGADAVELAAAIKPDIILLDVELPDKRGDLVMRSILSKFPDIKVLAVSAYHDRQYVRSMLNSGASGYITKDEVPSTLLRAIRKIINDGEKFFSRKVLESKLLSNSSQPTLTHMEVDILKQVTEGIPETVIAEKLNIDERRVNTYIRLLMGKYGVDLLSGLKALGRKYFSDPTSI